MNDLAAARPDAKKIIDTILEAMHKGIEHFDDEFSLVPGEFEVHLHPEAYQEMESIFPYIVERAEVQLDRALQHLNEGTPTTPIGRLASWFKGVAKGAETAAAADPTPSPARFRHAGYGWALRFNMTLDPAADLGYVAVLAELSAPRREHFSGPKTRRLTMRLPGGGYQTKTLRPDEVVAEKEEGAPAREPTTDSGPSDATIRTAPAAAVASAKPRIAGQSLATLSYKDDSGPHTVTMRTSELVIGRGGEGADGVAVTIHTVRDVSRRHLVIRYLPASGSFEVKDVSSLGTTVNGRLVPPSVDKTQGHDMDRWEALPSKATIGLAGVILIDFESLV